MTSCMGVANLVMCIWSFAFTLMEDSSSAVTHDEPPVCGHSAGAREGMVLEGRQSLADTRLEVKRLDLGLLLLLRAWGSHSSVGRLPCCMGVHGK